MKSMKNMLPSKKGEVPSTLNIKKQIEKKLKKRRAKNKAARRSRRLNRK